MSTIAEIHMYFYAIRLIGEAASFVAFCLLTFQLYRDRHELKDLKKNHRVFRLCAFFAALLLTVAHIDFYGVFAILPRLYLAAHYIVIFWIISGAMAYALHHSLIAAFPFLFFSDRDRKRTALSVTVFVYYIAGNIIYMGTILPGTHSVLAAAFVTVAFLASFVPAVALFTYLRLKHNLGINSGASDQTRKRFVKIVQKWRKYSIAVLMFSLLVIIMWLALSVGQFRQLGEPPDVVGFRAVHGDPTSIPSPAGMLAHILFVYLMLWFSWRGPSQYSKSSNDNVNVSNNSASGGTSGSVQTSKGVGRGGGTSTAHVAKDSTANQSWTSTASPSPETLTSSLKRQHSHTRGQLVPTLSYQHSESTRSQHGPSSLPRAYGGSTLRPSPPRADGGGSGSGGSGGSGTLSDRDFRRYSAHSEHPSASASAMLPPPRSYSEYAPHSPPHVPRWCRTQEARRISDAQFARPAATSTDQRPAAASTDQRPLPPHRGFTYGTPPVVLVADHPSLRGAAAAAAESDPWLLHDDVARAKTSARTPTRTPPSFTTVSGSGSSSELDPVRPQPQWQRPLFSHHARSRDAFVVEEV